MLLCIYNIEICLSCCRQVSANMLCKLSNDAPRAGVLGGLGLLLADTGSSSRTV